MFSGQIWKQKRQESQISFIIKIEAHEFDPGKTLILCPRRQFAYIIRDALGERGNLAHSFFRDEALDGNPKNINDCSAQEAFTLLTLLTKPDDRVALRCWLGFGSRNLRSAEYQRLREYCSHNRLSPREVLGTLTNGDLSMLDIPGIWDRYKLLVQHLEKLRTAPVEEVRDKIFPDDQEWAKPFRAMIDDSEDSTDDNTLENMLDSLRTNITQPELPSVVDYIRIMSLHKSKGLNADHVVITGCIEGLIPSRNTDLSFDEQVRFVEEQRRLFYVAITRPKKTLVLSSVLSLPRALAHKMGANQLGSNRRVARTITSAFIGELGSQCPKPVSGNEWVY